MYYIVQENTFREENYDVLIKSLERLGLEYEIVSVWPFTDEVLFKTDRKDVFVFGSLKLARISKLHKWIPGSLMSNTHDYNVYSEHYKENLLNYDSKIYKFTDYLNWVDLQSSHKFIRPCLDSKTFTGKVFNKEEWDEFVERSLTNGHTTSLTKDTLIQVATPKNIQKEIRCWVVGGKVITASQYRLGYRTVSDSIVEPDAIEFAQKMVDIYQLADAFVIDVCLTNGEWKIVECGCINCAGFYKADLMKVIVALEDFYQAN